MPRSLPRTFAARRTRAARPAGAARRAREMRPAKLGRDPVGEQQREYGTPGRAHQRYGHLGMIDQLEAEFVDLSIKGIAGL